MANKLIDQKIDFAQIKNRGLQLESNWSAYKTKADNMEAAYLGTWTGAPDSSQAKIIVSPSARNKAGGAIQLLISDPKFHMPYDQNDDDARQKSELVEKFVKSMWNAAGRARQRPIHYDAVTSAVLYGRIDMSVVNVKDLVANAASKSNPNATKRLEQIALLTPFLFEVYDPRTGYPEYDSFGLSSYCRKVSMKSGEIIDRWGDAALGIGFNPTSRNDDIDYYEFWDSVVSAAWTDRGTLMCMEHGLPCIPIVSQIVSGSTLFEKNSDKVQPYLQTLVESGLWEAENISLSAMATYAAKLGVPTYVAHLQNPDEDVRIDKSVIGGVLKVGTSENVTPLVQKVIDDSLQQLYQVSTKLTEDSTMPSQTLGTPISSNASYSVTALLHQAGRISISQIQNMTGWAIGRAVEVALLILRDVAGASKAHGVDGMPVKLTSADVPKAFTISCVIDPDLPQDKRQDTMIFQQITSGDNPGASVRWGREKILGIDQSSDMDQEIVEEKLKQMELQKTVQIEMARTQAAIQAEVAKIQMQQQQQQGMMPGGQPGMPQQPPPQGIPQGMPPDMQQQAGPGQNPPEAMQGMPPEMIAQMQGAAPGAGLPGMPLSGPLTPEQMGQQR